MKTNKKQGSIIRTVKDKHHPYVVINKKPLQDENLSWKAKGILAYCMSLPDNWTLVMSEVKEHAKDKTASFWSGIKELKERGYLKYVVARNEKNKIQKHIYYIRESLDINFPDIENPDLENGYVENRHLINNESNEYGIEKNTKSHCRASERSSDRLIISNFDKHATQKLHDIILTHKNMNLNISQWPNTFRLLRTTNKVSKTRIKKVMLWYANHIGGDYVPVALSAKSFRDKFIRLEDAMNRGNRRSEPEGPTRRKGADGEWGWFEDD